MTYTEGQLRNIVAAYTRMTDRCRSPFLSLGIRLEKRQITHTKKTIDPKSIISEEYSQIDKYGRIYNAYGEKTFVVCFIFRFQKLDIKGRYIEYFLINEDVKEELTRIRKELNKKILIVVCDEHLRCPAILDFDEIKFENEKRIVVETPCFKIYQMRFIEVYRFKDDDVNKGIESNYLKEYLLKTIYR